MPPSPEIADPQTVRDTNRKIRQHSTCLGCNKPKPAGDLLCWHCFKYRDDCFKYYDRPSLVDATSHLDAWLKSIGHPSLKEQGIL